MLDKPGPLYLAVILALSLQTLTGCSPSLAPLYRDFQSEKSPEEVETSIANALESAGWTQTTALAPNAFKTEERTLNRRLVYKTVVSLEIVPIGDEYIRVFIHPYRDNFVGGRTKIPYLQSNVRKYVFPTLTEAFADEGLHELGNMPDSTDSTDSTGSSTEGAGGEGVGGEGADS